jgi:hypothetical protein
MMIASSCGSSSQPLRSKYRKLTPEEDAIRKKLQTKRKRQAKGIAKAMAEAEAKAEAEAESTPVSIVVAGHMVVPVSVPSVLEAEVVPPQVFETEDASVLLSSSPCVTETGVTPGSGFPIVSASCTTPGPVVISPVVDDEDSDSWENDVTPEDIALYVASQVSKPRVSKPYDPERTSRVEACWKLIVEQTMYRARIQAKRTLLHTVCCSGYKWSQKLTCEYAVKACAENATLGLDSYNPVTDGMRRKGAVCLEQARKSFQQACSSNYNRYAKMSSGERRLCEAHPELGLDVFNPLTKKANARREKALRVNSRVKEDHIKSPDAEQLGKKPREKIKRDE